MVIKLHLNKIKKDMFCWNALQKLDTYIKLNDPLGNDFDI